MKRLPIATLLLSIGICQAAIPLTSPDFKEKNKRKLEQQQKDNKEKAIMNGAITAVGGVTAFLCNTLKGTNPETASNQTVFIAGITAAVAGSVLAANAAIDWWQAKKKLEESEN